MSKIGLLIGQESATGPSRQHNEDYVGSVLPDDEAVREAKGVLFLVADGMGGHQAGEVASRAAVEWVQNAYYASTTVDVAANLVRAFQGANQVVYELAQSDPDKAGMGTTLVAAVVWGSPLRVTVANVGDSRAYLLHGRQLTQMTDDHSWVEEQFRAGLLTRSQAEKHPQRNLITRALGLRSAVEVDTFEERLRPGDVLLLCTDGVSSELSNHQMARVVASEPPAQAAAELVTRANEQGGNDNASAVVVRPDAEDAQAWQPSLAAAGGWAGRHRAWAGGLVALALACLLLAVAGGFWLVSQNLVQDAAAAPQPAPIYFEDLEETNLDQVAGLLGYQDLSQMRAVQANGVGPDPSGSARLWPVESGVFLVGRVQDWAWDDGSCRFRLLMAGQEFEVRCERASFLEGRSAAPNLGEWLKEETGLRGKQLRVYGLLEGERVIAQLMDLGTPWLTWWRPPWVTVYQATDYNWDQDVWVYGVLDDPTNSPVNMEDYSALERGDPILVQGRWLEEGAGDNMAFDNQRLYHLEEMGYVPFSGAEGPAPDPSATVTLRPRATGTSTVGEGGSP